VTLETVVGLLF